MNTILFRTVPTTRRTGDHRRRLTRHPGFSVLSIRSADIPVRTSYQADGPSPLDLP